MFFAKAAVEFQKTKHATGPPEHANPEQQAPLCADDFMNDGTTELLNTDDMYYEGEDVHVGKDKKVRSAKQHQHYRWRGHDLEELTPYEYVAMIDIKKRPTKSKPKRHGRQPNATFEFHGDHPMSKSHFQVLRSKFYVPMIRHSSPKLPKPGEPITKLQKERFAQWFGTLLFKWNPDSGLATVYTWDQLNIENIHGVDPALLKNKPSDENHKKLH